MFTADETQIGQRRTKVTLYRPLRQQGFDRTLSELLESKEAVSVIVSARSLF